MRNYLAITFIIALAALAFADVAASVGILDSQTAAAPYSFTILYEQGAIGPGLIPCSLLIDGQSAGAISDVASSVPETFTYSGPIQYKQHDVEISCSKGAFFTGTSVQKMSFGQAQPAAAPAVTINYPSNNAQFSQSETLSVRYKYDANGGATPVNCVLTFGGDQLSFHEIESGSTDEISVGTPSPGTYALYVACDDANSKSVAISETRHVTFTSAPIPPASPPKVALLFPDNNALYSPSETIKVRYKYDANGGPATVKCVLTFGGDQLRIATLDSGSTDEYAVGQISPGTYGWYVACEDENSKNVATSETRNAIVSSPPPATPTLTLSPADYAKFSTSEIVNVSYTYHANGGPSPVTCALTFNGEQKSTHEIESGSMDEITIGMLPDGTYLWNVACSDENSKPVVFSSAHVKVSAPNSGATVTLLYPENNYKSSDTVKNFQFKYDAGTNGPASAKCDLFIDGSASPSFSKPAVNDGETVDTGVIGVFTPDVQHKWQVVCGGSIASETSYFEIIGTSSPSIALNNPPPGTTVSSVGALNFTYFAGTTGPLSATCSAFLGGIEVTQKVPASDGISTVTGYPDMIGANNVLIICTGANGFSVQRNFLFTVDRNVKEPFVSASFPSNAFIAVGDTPVEFQFTYSAGTYQKQYPDAICSIMFAGDPRMVVGASDSVTAESGKQKSITAPVPATAKYWSVFCRQALDDSVLFPVESQARSISAVPANSNNGGSGGTSGGSPGGSGGSRGTGSGGGSFAPRPSTTAAASTAGTLAGAPLNQTPVAKTAESRLARLVAPEALFVNDTALLYLRDEGGRPLSAVDIYARIPGSTLSQKLTTDSLGRASFIPTKEGTYTYRLGSGYAFSGVSPSTVVSAKAGAATAATMSGIKWGDIFNYALVFIALVVLAALVASAYFLIAKKPAEE